VIVLSHLLLLLLALPAGMTSLYLLVLTLLSRAPPRRLHSARRTAPPLRFEVIVPAHDEAAAIVHVVASLRAMQWPADGFRILVVADNCIDATAALAAAAGAQVLVRTDPARRGKGHALDFAFRSCRDRAWADALVVVDADSRVSANLLACFAEHLDRGAMAVQAHYGVLNAGASWRTRLMAIALGSFHRLRSRARERLRLSCGIRGNGWCIRRDVLERVPYRAFTLAEDIEYGIELGLAGVRVSYADEARVDALMVTGEQAARTQRQRWEDGRWQLVRSCSWRLLRRAAQPGGAICLDLALDLLAPPLSYIAADIAVLIALSGLSLRWSPAAMIWIAAGSACGVCLVLYVLRGWQLSGVGRRGLLDLLAAPAFVLWKLALMLRPHDSTRWVRTKREAP
jgi:cellulose synthase/poly-beta-1,6-N-acetylglucosamine synthase-like glycosyltransferase